MEPSLDIVVVRDVATALLIGSLVGIEREKHKVAGGNVGIAGVRTFTLIALVGALAAWLTRELGTPWILVAALSLVAAILTAGYVVLARMRPDEIGMTTEAAALAVCLLGAMCVLGHPGLAAGLGIVTAAVLAYKQPLHGFVGLINRDELYAGLRLLIASIVVLPLLPRRTIDPWYALDPYSLFASTRPASRARTSFAAARLLMIAVGAHSVVLHSPSLLPSARPSPAEYHV